jgi:O-methyltransferase involved in polyketide biosynthesis
VQFIELDHPATSAAKAKGIALEGQPTNMFQIAADLGEHPLSKVLSEDGRWDTSLPSVLVAEGLLQYLTDEEVRGLLVEAAACTSLRSRLVFTHAKPGYRKLVTFLTGLVAEPWKSAVESEDLPEYVKGTGWNIISHVDTDEAHGVERYAVAERR